MSKIKIYDIRPPEKQKQPSIKQKPTPRFNVKRPSKTFKPPQFSFKKGGLLAGAGLLVIGFLFLHFSAQAEIKVFPSMRLVSDTKEATAKIETKEIDLKENIIPARIVEVEIETSENFSATGIAETATKAGGIIKVINDYNLQQVLVANTRFLSVDSKLFYSQERIVVPPGASVTVSVTAAESGADYNIDATTFSIPGLKGSPRWFSVSAESESSMMGGSHGEISKVTKNDLTNAEEKLIEVLEKKVFEALEQKSGADWLLLAGAENIEIVDISSSVQEGVVADVFKLTIKAEGIGLTIKRNGLEGLTQSWAKEMLDEKEKIKQDSLKIEAVVERADFSDGELRLTTNFSFEVLKDINEQMLKGALLGKSISEGKAYFSNYPDIERAEIKISPFWVKSISKNSDKLKIYILEDGGLTE